MFPIMLLCHGSKTCKGNRGVCPVATRDHKQKEFQSNGWQAKKMDNHDIYHGCDRTGCRLQLRI